MPKSCPMVFAGLCAGSLALGCTADPRGPTESRSASSQGALASISLTPPTHVAATLPLASQASLHVTTDGCSNSPGPTITLEGAIAFAGLEGDIIFENNLKGTHRLTEVAEGSIVLLPSAETISVPKQPVRGGAGGNPYIYVQLFDEDGGALTGQTLLGRCVQGLFAANLPFLERAVADLDVSVGGCDNSPGPQVSLTGPIALTGITAAFTLTNNRIGTHTADGGSFEADVTLLAPGETITIPKQPVYGGVGGNPIIQLLFTDDGGVPLSETLTLGRCVQLGK